MPWLHCSSDAEWLKASGTPSLRWLYYPFVSDTRFALQGVADEASKSSGEPVQRGERLSAYTRPPPSTLVDGSTVKCGEWGRSAQGVVDKVRSNTKPENVGESTDHKEETNRDRTRRKTGMKSITKARCDNVVKEGHHHWHKFECSRYNLAESCFVLVISGNGYV